jgi:hypothetical protein
MNGKKYKLDYRYPDRVWRDLQAQEQESIKKRVASIGWGAKAWFELANAIGLTIAPGIAATAVEPGKDARTYVSSAEEQTDSTYKLSVSNSSRLQNWIGGRTAFFSAIAGRVGFFNQNLKHGVFNDMKQVAAKYPGIEVNSD